MDWKKKSCIFTVTIRQSVSRREDEGFVQRSLIQYSASSWYECLEGTDKFLKKEKCII